jgi:hypothetical protein
MYCGQTIYTVLLCTADRSYRQTAVMYCWQTIHTVLLCTDDRSYIQCWHIIQTQRCYVLLTDHTYSADRSYRHSAVMYCWQTIHTVLTDHTHSAVKYWWQIIHTVLTDHTDTVLLCTADRPYIQCCYVLLTDHTDTVMLCTDESYTQCRYAVLIDPTDTVLTSHSWPAHCLHLQHVTSPTQEHLASKHTLYWTKTFIRLPLESSLRKYTAFTPLQPSLVTSISVSSLHYVHAVQVTQLFRATFTLHSNSVVRSPVLKSQLFPPVFCQILTLSEPLPMEVLALYVWYTSVFARYPVFGRTETFRLYLHEKWKSYWSDRNHKNVCLSV